MKNPVEKYYDRLASLYDQATAKSDSWTPPEYVAKELLTIKTKINKALIVGVGTGQDIPAINSIGALKIDAIDVSGEMLKLAKSKFPKVSFQKGDFMAVEKFEKGGYDLVICSGALEFIADFEGFFAKCSKLLKENGDLIVTYEPIISDHKIQKEKRSELDSDISKKWGISGFITYRHSPEEFMEKAQKAGFSLTNDFEFIAYKKMGESIIYRFAHLKKTACS